MDRGARARGGARISRRFTRQAVEVALRGRVGPVGRGLPLDLPHLGRSFNDSFAQVSARDCDAVDFGLLDHLFDDHEKKPTLENLAEVLRSLGFAWRGSLRK